MTRSNRSLTRACALVLALASIPNVASASELAYPPTAKRPVSDTYHGVTVIDDYRWLESDNDPEVRRWSAAQNQLTRGYLDAMPGREEIVERVDRLLRAAPVQRYDFVYRGRLFALKSQPPRNQPMLVALPLSGDVRGERVVLDPNALDPQGRTTIDFYKPSYDGRRVIVSLSRDGSEDGTAYVFDVATGRRLRDVIPGVAYPTGGGSVEWSADGRGFYYTRYPQGNERPAADRHFYQQVYYHSIGTPVASDRHVIGESFPRIAEIMLHGSRDGRHLLAEVHNGDGGEVAWHLRDPHGAWHLVADFKDGVKHVSLGDRALYAVSVGNAPLGRVLAIPLDTPALANARTIVAESDIVAAHILATRHVLYVTYRAGGPSLVRMFTLQGEPLGEMPSEPVSDTVVAERLRGDDVLVRTMSYVTPRSWYRFDASARRLVPTELNGRPPFDFADAVVERDSCSSKDGTQVPITIVHAASMPRDGARPTLLYGYGGYGISMSPYYSPLLRLWLDYGGVYAVANVRGGGEFGEPWHLAGNLTHKQNVFDDFASCLQRLVDRKYSNPERLAIMGGSNGGLLMGATLTQHPEMMRAVVSAVGIYDALRWETQPNGAFNVTEFGSVEDPEQFRALHAYSPLARIKDGTRYPAVLLTAGDNDGRVAPYESRKMAARLQAATASDRPILLRTEAAAGHGAGTALAVRVQQEADVYAFLTSQLGMQPVPRAGADAKAQ
ncbi:MAG TPA: prolyl oligopeptidase family serine peptidase [Casimicrobiaceae bacterium]|nr:prolyl oligopeptidase family serine peptidase [Casimicrobiaceae bacterium]